MVASPQHFARLRPRRAAFRRPASCPLRLALAVAFSLALPAGALAVPGVLPGVLPDAPSVASDPLKHYVTENIDRLTPDRRLTSIVAGAYAANGYRPIWTGFSGLSANARAALGRIADADADGLNPARFAAFLKLANATDTPSEAADVATSLAVVAYALDAWGGSVSPSSIDAKDIGRHADPLDTGTILKTVSEAPDAAAALDAYNPPSPEFQHLKKLLATLQGGDGRPAPGPQMVTVPPGPRLYPGAEDPRVPALRQRLGFQQPVADGNRYDNDLVEAVRAFQKNNGLKADGIVTQRTLAVLNLPRASASRLAAGDVLANMEMWRWMPRNFGRDFVLVNIPDFTADVVRDGQLLHSTRVVVGKPSTPTPLFSGVMQYLDVNPSWNVPESIRVKELLPEIQKNPAAFFERTGYEAVRNGHIVDPSKVDWQHEITEVGIRQPPGEANALGHIKFMFPNSYAVYLHDTPMRKLFSRDVRAFSHGCVRVDNPLDFAAAVLKDDPTWTVDKVQALYGGPEQRIDLAHKLNVHIGYFTVWVADNGQVHHSADIYGYAGRVSAELARQRASVSPAG